MGQGGLFLFWPHFRRIVHFRVCTLFGKDQTQTKKESELQNHWQKGLAMVFLDYSILCPVIYFNDYYWCNYTNPGNHLDDLWCFTVLSDKIHSCFFKKEIQSTCEKTNIISDGIKAKKITQ